MVKIGHTYKFDKGLTLKSASHEDKSSTQPDYASLNLRSSRMFLRPTWCMEVGSLGAVHACLSVSLSLSSNLNGVYRANYCFGPRLVCSLRGFCRINPNTELHSLLPLCFTHISACNRSVNRFGTTWASCNRNVKDVVPHKHKTRGSILILCSLLFSFPFFPVDLAGVCEALAVMSLKGTRDYRKMPLLWFLFFFTGAWILFTTM